MWREKFSNLTDNKNGCRRKFYGFFRDYYLVATLGQLLFSLDTKTINANK